MKENLEKYIEGLSPELQEKARACKTVEELNEFIADNDLEIPEDALEMVAGGCGKKSTCPKCGSTNIKLNTSCGAGFEEHCGDCGYIISHCYLS